MLICFCFLNQFESSTLSAFNIEQTLHVSEMVFDHVVLGLIVMFLLGYSSEWLTVVVLWRKGKE